jgi:hypothetical protein
MHLYSTALLLPKVPHLLFLGGDKLRLWLALTNILLNSLVTSVKDPLTSLGTRLFHLN